MIKSIGNFFGRLMLRRNTVYALVGESGTGKSFRARLVTEKYRLSAIIDDGLLIQDDKILAGHSAKREQTYMGAVRAALFDNKEHRDEIARAIQKSHITRILILGTSEKMVQKIATRLQLPPPEKIIRIQDIATREEIEKAMRSRQIEGKHVIPVPSIEVRRSYPQIFSNSIRLFLTRKGIFPKAVGGDAKIFEKSIVQPEFSKKGRIEISEAALTQMVMHCVSECSPETKIKKMAIKADTRGYRLTITIDVPYGVQLAETVSGLQKYIIEKVEGYTGILIEEVSIIIDKVSAKAAPSEERAGA